MTQPQLPLVQPAPTRRRGRPPGAKNRRSADLARYVEATYGGMTPGQQAAELAMVKPAELKKAKDAAIALGLIVEAQVLPVFTLAMVVKARALATALGCEAKEAWLLLQRERADLLPYIHQKQAPAADKKGAAPATVFLIPEGEASQAQLPDFSVDDEADIEFVEDFSAPAEQVGQIKSDDTP